MSIKNRSKVFAIIALVLHIGRYVFAVPFDLASPFMGLPVGNESQLIFDVLYYVATLLPFFLVLISGIISGIKSKKQERLD